ncbi:hypothetical protein T09_7023, partial [Trichinella sp. T9]
MQNKNNEESAHTFYYTRYVSRKILEIKKIVPLCLIATRDSFESEINASYLFEGYRSFFSGNADEVDTVLNDRQVITER